MIEELDNQDEATHVNTNKTEEEVNAWPLTMTSNLMLTTLKLRRVTVRATLLT
jgi:hypothetical protein